MSGERLLVPVSQSPTLRATVTYAVESALSTDGPAYVRFVFVHSPEVVDEAGERTAHLQSADELLSRLAVWADDDAGSEADRLTVETDHLGTEEYLFSPADVAAALGADAKAHDIGRIVVDPEYDPNIGAPLIRPLERELQSLGLDIDEVPRGRTVQRTPLLGRSTPKRIGALFGLTFVFYQVLGGVFDLFDIVTGAVSAVIVAVALAKVTFGRDPTRLSFLRAARALVYVPYLLVEIVKANVAVAAVILHPRMPIDPRLARVRPAVWGALPVTTLANSITLTPGTLTVRVDGRTLTVHTLIPAARNDLFDGGLERAVRFLFYGRRSMRLDSLTDRGEAEILQAPPEDDSGGEHA